jgi:broad specificity phosphatase PhoE
LTTLGLSQAERTGEFFAKFCPGVNVDENITADQMHLGFDHFVIETSPFIRCIQTANKIAEKLGVTKIKINYMASEFLHEQLYPDGCPL